MDVEIAKKWVEALRSGEYKQGHEVLRGGNEFCCLGVLCDLALKEKAVEAEWTPEYRGRTYFSEPDNRSETYLTHGVAKWAGVKSRSPRVVSNGTSRPLSDLNDTAYTFDQIANLIEEQAESL